VKYIYLERPVHEFDAIIAGLKSWLVVSSSLGVEVADKLVLVERDTMTGEYCDRELIAKVVYIEPVINEVEESYEIVSISAFGF